VIEHERGNVFVGREHELQELLRGFDDAAAGRGRLVLLAGEAGIGKSRLADELASRARHRGARVLWGKCWGEAGVPAYWPWIQGLRSYLRSADPEDVRSQLAGGAGDIAQVLPEVGAIVADVAPPPAIDPESARFRLFDSLTAFMINAARSTPLVFVLDDLQVADTASIRLLHFLASQLTESRILVIATYRDGELAPDDPLAGYLPEFLREPATLSLRLAGLGQSAVGEFVEATAGLGLGSTVVAALWQETGGNPLFLGEAVRALSAEGRPLSSVDPSSLRVAVPRGVRDLIARRLQELDDRTVEALTFGAVMGPEFSIETLRAVGGYGADELLDLFDQPMHAGLLVAVPGALGRLRFAHDLVRETLYGELSTVRRIRLHRQVASALEAHYGATADAHLPELAHHYFEAARGGDPGPAVDFARRAGDEAAHSLAYEEAVRFYEMALQACESIPADDEIAVVDLLLALGDAEARAGEFDRARTTFLRAARVAKRLGATSLLAQAALGYGGRFVWARAGSDPHIIPLLQDALVLLGGDDDRLRVRLLTRLACALRSSPDREHSDALSQQAVTIARQLGDPRTLCYALEGRFGAIWWPENPDERLALARETIALAEQIGDIEIEATARMAAESALADLARMTEARAEAEVLSRRARELRQPAQQWMAGTIGAELILFGGDFARAEPLIQDGLRLEAHQTSAADERSSSRSQLFILRRDQDRLQEMEEMVRLSIDEFPWYPLHRCALALLLAELGRLDEARVVFDDVARDDFAVLYRDNEWLLGMAFASEACALLGDAGSAVVLYEQLRPFAGRHILGHSEGAVGAADRYLGLLAHAMGRHTEAKAHLAEAIRINALMNGRPWIARSQFDLAGVLMAEAQSTPAEADHLLREALATAREIGMVALERAIVSRLAPAAEARESVAGPNNGRGLFHREGEYWTVALGGEPVRIRDTKGMRYLARLLSQPGHELHALDLARSSDPEGSAGVPDPELRSDAMGDAGALLDPAAKAAYRLRLEDLRSEIAEAEAFNDLERAARARQEVDFLASELAGAVGLGGRDRKAASSAERARLSVTRAIRAALARIAEQSPDLGHHLDATIRTGTYCSYNPDPRLPITWGT